MSKSSRLASALLLALSLPAMAESITWKQSPTSLTAMQGTQVLWQIVADPAQGKPYFHPLATPGGLVLSDLRPSDHPWHRGLWFSWKFINGVNYWEEDRKTQRSAGTTELLESHLTPHDDGSARLEFSLAYHPANQPPVMTEKRTLLISAPQQGHYEIDWSAEFTALSPVTLTPTPVKVAANGVSSGGYAGFSLRINPALKKWVFSNSLGAEGELKVHGKPAAWVKFSSGAKAPAVAFFDDPANQPYPASWFTRPAMPFMSAAILYAGDRSLAKDEKLTLHYRVLVTDQDQLQATGPKP